MMARRLRAAGRRQPAAPARRRPSTVTALSLPLISLALHRSPRRALGPLALITVLFAARLRGPPGSPLPSSPEVVWNRFLLDRDER